VPIELQKRRRVLPHWTPPGGTYFVAFRLQDSLPGFLATDILSEQRNIYCTAQQMGRILSPGERKRLGELHRKLELVLDRGAGKCWMKDPAVARVVADALSFFGHTRYELVAWCVMPNHVHVVVQRIGTWELARILHSWKSFSAHELVRRFGCPTPVWQRESYDRLLRNPNEFARAIRYVENNPAVAGLVDWPWVSKR
jgi:REP element-mobilizing transposase RayT